MQINFHFSCNLCTAKCWPCFVMVFAILVWPVYAEAISSTSAQKMKRSLGDSCRIGLPSGGGFTEVEKWAWGQICMGKTAVMPMPFDVTKENKNKSCGPPRPEQTDNWANQPSERRILSARFIKLVTTHAPYMEISAKRLVHIECAVVDGKIDLSNEEIKPELRLNNSFIKDGLDVSNAYFRHDLSVSGSVVENALDGTGAVFNRNLWLAKGRYDTVGLHNAKIEESFSAVDSVFLDSFTASLIKVGDIMHIERVKFNDEVFMPAAKVNGSFFAANSAFLRPFRAADMKVDGNISITDVVFSALVNLSSSKVDGWLYVIDSVFEEEFVALSLEIGGNMILRNNKKFNNVGLQGTEIGGTLDINGSRFNGLLNLDHVQIVKDFVLYDQNGKSVPLWGSKAELILRNTHARALHVNLPDSLQTHEKKFLSIDLIGFTYDKLITPGGAKENLEQVVEWIEESPVYGGGAYDDKYRPQPYAQLAKALRETGAMDQAEEADMARLDHYYRTLSWKDQAMNKSWGRIRSLADYGIRFTSLLLFFLGFWLFVLIAAPAARLIYRSPKADWESWTQRCYHCFMYSFENSIPIPLMKFSPFRRRINLTGTRRLAHAFHLIRLAGFILAFIAAVMVSFLGEQ